MAKKNTAEIKATAEKIVALSDDETVVTGAGDELDTRHLKHIAGVYTRAGGARLRSGPAKKKMSELSPAYRKKIEAAARKKVED